MDHYAYFASRYGADRRGILGRIARHFARKDAAAATAIAPQGYGFVRATGRTAQETEVAYLQRLTLANTATEQQRIREEHASR